MSEDWNKTGPFILTMGDAGIHILEWGGKDGCLEDGEMVR